MLNRINFISIISLILILGCNQNIQDDQTNNKEILNELYSHEELNELARYADSLLHVAPTTITTYRAEQSDGGLHDYYSEGSYWWPDPKCETCKYIRRDGYRNPDNFKDHKVALKDFTTAVSILAAAYHLTNNAEYAHHALAHLEAWFISPDSKMHPHLQYSQAIKGISSGRDIGIIDGTNLIYIAMSVEYLSAKQILTNGKLQEVRQWFDEFTEWLTTHPYGIGEKDKNNNHSTWWGAQVAAYARVAARTRDITLCQSEFKNQLDIQMSSDGSFPEELSRTKPFHYMNYNLDAWTCYAHLASTSDVNLWDYQSKNGNIIKSIDFAVPFYKDPTLWPYITEIEPTLNPVRNNFLFLACANSQNPRLHRLWKTLPEGSNDKILNRAKQILFILTSKND